MANLALNCPRKSRFANPLQLCFEPILLAAHLLAQPNYGDNTCSPGFSNSNSKTIFFFPSPRLFDFKNPYARATPTAAGCDYSACNSLETITVPIHISLLPL
jgi:hypothetical protein